MTTSPDLRTGSQLLPGLIAVALFVFLSAVFLTSSFGAPQGFPADVSITASIGYALFNLEPDGIVPAEGFLATFVIIAIVLDAALDGAVLLGRKEDEPEPASEARADGGRGAGESDGRGGER